MKAHEELGLAWAKTDSCRPSPAILRHDAGRTRRSRSSRRWCGSTISGGSRRNGQFGSVGSALRRRPLHGSRQLSDTIWLGAACLRVLALFLVASRSLPTESATASATDAGESSLPVQRSGKPSLFESKALLQMYCCLTALSRSMLFRVRNTILSFMNGLSRKSAGSR